MSSTNSKSVKVSGLNSIFLKFGKGLSITGGKVLITSSIFGKGSLLKGFGSGFFFFTFLILISFFFSSLFGLSMIGGL